MCKRGTDLELALLTIWRYQLSITPPAAANAFITSVINIVLCVPLPPLEAFIALFNSDIEDILAISENQTRTRPVEFT